MAIGYSDPVLGATTLEEYMAAQQGSPSPRVENVPFGPPAPPEPQIPEAPISAPGLTPYLTQRSKMDPMMIPDTTTRASGRGGQVQDIFIAKPSMSLAGRMSDTRMSPRSVAPIAPAAESQQPERATALMSADGPLMSVDQSPRVSNLVSQPSMEPAFTPAPGRQALASEYAGYTMSDDGKAVQFVSSAGDVKKPVAASTPAAKELMSKIDARASSARPAPRAAARMAGSPVGMAPSTPEAAPASESDIPRGETTSFLMGVTGETPKGMYGAEQRAELPAQAPAQPAIAPAAPAVAPAQASVAAGKVEPSKGAEVQVKPAQEAVAKKAAEELAPSERGAAAAQVPGAPTTMDTAAMVKGIQTSFSQEYLQKRAEREDRISAIDKMSARQMTPEIRAERSRLIEENIRDLSLEGNRLNADAQRALAEADAKYGADIANKTRAHFENIDRHIATIERNAEEAAKLSVDPNRPFKDQPGKSWIAAIAVGLGEFGRSLTKGNVNLASHIIDKMVNDDIEAQKVEIDQARGKVKDAQNALAAIERTGVPKLQAEAMLRNEMYAAVQGKIQQIGLSSENEQIRIKAAVMNGAINERRDQQIAQIAAARASFIAQQRKMMADAEARKVELDLKRARAFNLEATGRAAEARALAAGQGEEHPVFDPVTGQVLGTTPFKQSAERQAALNNAVAGLTSMVPDIDNLLENSGRLAFYGGKLQAFTTGEASQTVAKTHSVLAAATPLITAALGEKTALGLLKKADEELKNAGAASPQTLANIKAAIGDAASRTQAQARALAGQGAAMRAAGISAPAGSQSVPEPMPATPSEDKE